MRNLINILLKYFFLQAKANNSLNSRLNYFYHGILIHATHIVILYLLTVITTKNCALNLTYDFGSHKKHNL